MLYTQIKLTYISGLYTPRLLILLFESRYIERGRWNLATRSGVCQVNRVRDERHAWTTFLMQKDVRFSLIRSVLAVFYVCGAHDDVTGHQRRAARLTKYGASLVSSIQITPV